MEWIAERIVKEFSQIQLVTDGLRSRTFQVADHRGQISLNTEIEQLTEKRLVRAMFNSRSIPLLGTVIDYEVPLKDTDEAAHGDTITVLVNEESIKVRLEGIDAPESGQSFGTQSKQALSEMVFGKQVTIRKTGEDRYGRTLGFVIVGDVDANAKMIEDGWAWHFKKYNDEERLAKLEVAARKAKRGLWADESPLAPWDYRARQKTPQAKEADPKALYWLNTSSGVRHNERCEHFKKTKKGRLCGSDEGKACGICGG